MLIEVGRQCLEFDDNRVKHGVEWVRAVECFTANYQDVRLNHCGLFRISSFQKEIFLLHGVLTEHKQTSRVFFLTAVKCILNARGQYMYQTRKVVGRPKPTEARRDVGL